MSRWTAVAVGFSLLAGIGTAWWYSNAGGPAISAEDRHVAATWPGQAEDLERAAPPRSIRIRQIKSKPAVETNPAARGYDPVEVATVLDQPTAAVFAAEPRNEAWARPFESQLRSLVAASLTTDLPSASVVEVECRTSSCKLILTVDAELGDAAHAYVQTMTPLGSVVAPSFGDLVDGRQTLIFHALVGPDLREPPAFGEFFQRWREQRDREGFLQELWAHHGI